MNGRRAENVKNGRSHKIVLEGDLAEIIERRWVAREFTRDDNTVALSQFVFHLEGCPIGDFRKAWATACRAAGLVKPQLDKNGTPVTGTENSDCSISALRRFTAVSSTKHGPCRCPRGRGNGDQWPSYPLRL
jgi:hypothetical protein